MENNNKTQVIGITGASGFIGKNLSQYLLSKGFSVTPLNRGFSTDELKNCHIVINLAGASINKRWSKSYKKEILDSRLVTTKKITSYIKENGNISLLISASAVGIYSWEHRASNDEFNNIYGNDFLANVCKEWEREALIVKEKTDVVIVRLGLVMSQKGGALPKMTLPAKLGVAAVLGKGNQVVSWVMLEDLLRAIEYIINNHITGIVNICSPNATTNREITKAIAKKHNSLLTIKIPSFIIKLLMGESSSVIINGQYVVPKRLKESDFSFKYPFFTLKN